MHCALLKHRHMALSAPLVDAARGSAQRPNLVQLYRDVVAEPTQMGLVVAPCVGQYGAIEATLLTL